MRTDGIEEVLHMRGAHLVLSGLDFLFFLIQNGLVRSLDVAAGDLKPALVPDELDTLSIRLILTVRMVVHQDAVRVFHGRVFRALVTLGNIFHRTGAVHSEGSLGDVVHVRAPVRGIAVPGFLVPTPSPPQFFVLGRIQGHGRTEIRVVMNLRIVQRAQPLVEIQVGGHRHFGQIQRLGSIPDPHIDLLDVSERAIPHQADGLLEFRAGPLLTPHLEDPTVVPDSRLDSKPLGDRIGERLLQVEILSGIQCIDGDQGMPVVGRRDADDIDVLPIQQVLVELVHVTAFVHVVLLLPLGHVPPEAFPLDGIHITAGRDLHARTGSEAPEIASPLSAETDEAEHDPVARSDLRTVRHYPARQDGQTGEPEG